MLCLQKDVRKRVADIRDVRLALEGAFETVSPQVAEAVAVALPVWRRLLPVGTALVVGGVLVGLAVWVVTQPDPQPVNRFDYDLPENQQLASTGRPALALSPDGRHFVYNTEDGFYLRTMGALEARLILGTEQSFASPVFSPDGQAVAYWEYPVAQLRRVTISSGAAVLITDVADNLDGLSWEADGTILFGQPEGIYRVPATGGTAELIIPEEQRVYGARLLPDGDSVLFSLRQSGDWDTAQIVAQSLSTGEREVLIEGGSDAHYVPTGHIIYALGGSLFAMAFDPDSLTVSGGAVPLLQGVRRATNGRTGAAFYGVSEDGTLIYVSGAPVNDLSTLVWVDRNGRQEPFGIEPRDYFAPGLSPDGRSLAFSVSETDQNSDVWTYDLTRGIPTRLTFEEGIDGIPLWTPDSQRIVFYSGRDGGGLFWMAANGTGEAERLTTKTGPTYHAPMSFLPDGSQLIYATREGDQWDLYALSMDGDHTPELLLGTEFNELYPAFSPDGRWLAYSSNESGQGEVYVRPYPNIDDNKWRVSRDRGAEPVWGPDGQELFYRVFNTLMVLSVEDEPSFLPGLTEELFTWDQQAGPGSTYDVSPDGQWFLMNISGEIAGTATQIIVVQNWFEEVRRLAPAAE
jgi:serine/threonine-protein kinase